MKTLRSARDDVISDRRGFRKSLKNDKTSSKLKAAEYIDKALHHESLGNFEQALNYYEDAAENLPPNGQLSAKIATLKHRLDENFEGVAHKRVRKSNEVERTVRGIVSKYAHIDNDAESGQPPVDNTHDDNGLLDNVSEEDPHPSLPLSDDLNDSIMTAESSVYPREVMISNLQQKTLAALEYQLFDRLNNGDFDELVQLSTIGRKRAQYILEVREEWSEQSEEPCFTSVAQLEDIGMRPKDCQQFLKRNAALLMGLQ